MIGPWQVVGRNHASFGDRVHMDVIAASRTEHPHDPSVISNRPTALWHAPTIRLHKRSVY
jgi:hypothetical protein